MISISLMYEVVFNTYDSIRGFKFVINYFLHERLGIGFGSFGVLFFLNKMSWDGNL